MQFKILIFLISSMGTFGSLYFSEIMNLPPCSLCWYQRIFLYPIFFISLVNILRSDFNDHTHELTLAIAGLAIAFYHNLLYYGIIENIVPCSQGVSCTSRQIEWFGVVTIPLLSLLAFVCIVSIIIVSHIFKEPKKHVGK